MNAGVFVGLDIGRSSLQAAARPAGQKWVVKPDDAGICEIANVLTSVQPEIIVIEAQGGIELPVAGTLATSGLPLAFVSRRNVREFARSVGARGDRSHAELLAHFAELARPEVRPIPNTVVELTGVEDPAAGIVEHSRARTKSAEYACHTGAAQYSGPYLFSGKESCLAWRRN